jgi:hypothetical protein
MLPPEEESRRAKLKAAVTKMWAANKLTDQEATRRIDEIDAEPLEACGSA